MRKAAVEMVGTNLLSEAAPFSFRLKSGGEEIRAAPLVYIPDLGAKVLELLEQNERYIRGRWHQGSLEDGGVLVALWGGVSGLVLKGRTLRRKGHLNIQHSTPVGMEGWYTMR